MWQGNSNYLKYFIEVVFLHEVVQIFLGIKIRHRGLAQVRGSDNLHYMLYSSQVARNKQIFKKICFLFWDTYMTPSLSIFKGALKT